MGKKLNRSGFILLTVGLIVVAATTLVAIRQGWFVRQVDQSHFDQTTMNGEVGSEGSDSHSPKTLGQLLGVAENDVIQIGGVERPASDTNYLKPEKIDFGSRNPMPRPEVPKRIASDTNEVVAGLAKDLSDPKKSRLASSPYAVIAPFDIDAYKKAPEQYLNQVRPNRINQTAQAAVGVTPLESDSPRFSQIVRGEKVVMRVRGTRGMPVTFHTNQAGKFENDLKTITLAFDDEGVAVASFEPDYAGIGVVNVLAGSPVHSGQLKFVMRVLRGESQQ